MTKEQTATVLAATQINEDGNSRTVYREIKKAKAKRFLAVHPITEELSSSNVGWFRITHTPTGYMVGKYEREDVAIAIRNALVASEIDWEFTDPKDITRDIANRVKQIRDDVLTFMSDDASEGEVEVASEEERIAELEDEGLTTSDAQAAAEAEQMPTTIPDPENIVERENAGEFEDDDEEDFDFGDEPDTDENLEGEYDEPFPPADDPTADEDVEDILASLEGVDALDV